VKPTIAEALNKLGYTIQPSRLFCRRAIYKSGTFIGDFTAFQAIEYLEATYGPHVLEAENTELGDNNPVKTENSHEPRTK
jgi:hypothetical protein